jgi:hypothetical protein
MRLENQAVTNEDMAMEKHRLLEQYLSTWARRLWDKE